MLSNRFKFLPKRKFSLSHKDLLVHCGYHKVLTALFHHVLNGVSVLGKLPLQEVEDHSVLQQHVRIYINPQSRIKKNDMPPFRGTHIIRDPRDLIVSGYFYHLRTCEPWCVKVNPDSGWDVPKGTSYQQHLLSLPQNEGLLLELRNVSGQTIRRMQAWDYSDPRFLELRYEDVVGLERVLFEKVFSWYGFESQDITRCMTIVDKFSLSRLQSRKSLWRNRELQNHVQAGGRKGKWKKYFTPELRQAFVDEFDRVLIELGYERDNCWASEDQS